MDTENNIRKRGGIKASLTNFARFVQTMGQTPMSKAQFLNLLERTNKLEVLFDNYQHVQSEIEMSADQAELEVQYLERANFENSYFENLAKAKELLSVVEEEANQNSVSVSEAGAQDSGSVSEIGAQVQQMSVKLPDISLPSFDGGFENWLEFRETFQTLIHNNAGLSGIQKFHYLRASLRGKASDAIKSIEFSEKGYDTAWKGLLDRFDNHKLLIHNHLRAIFSFESITKESAVKLRELADQFSKHLSSIKQLGRSTDGWDTLIIFIAATKLDNKTAMDWEKTSAPNADPTLKDFFNFLRNRSDVLQTIEFKGSSNKPQPDKYLRHERQQSSKAFLAQNNNCYFCKGDHFIYSCKEFTALSIKQRFKFVNDERLCRNCIRSGHSATQCKLGPCKKCHRFHNTLLHFDNSNQEIGPNKDSSDQGEVIVAFNAKKQVSVSNHVILATAQVLVYDKQGNSHCVRALLDSGSQSSFISEDLVNVLGLVKENANLSISGIASNTFSVKSKCSIQILSKSKQYKFNLTCFILPKITHISSMNNAFLKDLHIPSDIQLADSSFPRSGKVDILIGADLFWHLLEKRRISCGKNMAILQQTKLGWILSGMVSGNAFSDETLCNLSTNQLLQVTLAKFWEIEEISTEKSCSSGETQCEQIFTNTTRRSETGRFVVTMPLKQSPEVLGDSHEQAEKRFLALERKLNKNKPLRESYVKFMREYVELGHMSPDNIPVDSSTIQYFMPHHGVMKESSLTTKLRVVFDASAHTSSGISLNNIQFIGPVLQDDLFSILIRFRKHRYVISADIAKMYRQVLIAPEHRQLQKILWRENPSSPLLAYQLNTVTYGQACASFLAIRCLRELAYQCSNDDISRSILHDFYVDDLLTGTDTIQNAQYMCQEISDALLKGGFELRKWYSNEPIILQSIKSIHNSTDMLEFASSESAKILGLLWSSKNDVLSYKIDIPEVDNILTKRSVLSIISRIFDPLGLLSPFIVTSKILMQRLWATKVSWDEGLPSPLCAEWNQFRRELCNLNNVQLRRQVIHTPFSRLELHGFSDASEKAYGACLYIKSVGCSDGTSQVHLLCSKSRVAPLKSLTIPKLELCAALLLSRLVKKVVDSMNIQFDKCYLWSDSTIVLAWLKTEPNLLKVFVSNRVSEIQDLTSSFEWLHISSKDNPADLVSRGISASKIIDDSMWWYGPDWLKEDFSEWPKSKASIQNLPELRPINHCTVSCLARANESFPFDRFSSFSRLHRVLAYMHRFISNCRKPVDQRRVDHLSASELKNSLTALIKMVQSDSFPNELMSLSKGNIVNRQSKLSGLNPFKDTSGVMRAGGRLKHSDFAYSKKHPIILDGKHHFTKILFNYEHIRLLHAGPQMLLSSIRYWEEILLDQP